SSRSSKPRINCSAGSNNRAPLTFLRLPEIVEICHALPYVERLVAQPHARPEVTLLQRLRGRRTPSTGDSTTNESGDEHTSPAVDRRLTRRRRTRRAGARTRRLQGGVRPRRHA